MAEIPINCYTYLEHVDLESLGGQLLAKFIENTQSLTQDELVLLVVRLQFQKIQYIRELKATNASNLDSALHSLAQLSMTSNDEEESDRKVSKPSDQGLQFLGNDIVQRIKGKMSYPRMLENDARACLLRIREFARIDRKSAAKKWQLLQAMLTAIKPDLPLVCHTGHIDNLSNAIYAVSSDALHHPAPLHTEPFDIDNEFQIYVISHLRLCGGRPADADMCTLKLSATFGDILRCILDVHLSNGEMKHPRLGGLSEDWLPGGRWLFQASTDLNTLNEHLSAWNVLHLAGFTDIKTIPRTMRDEGIENQHIFIIHSMQLEIPRIIREKQQHLETVQGLSNNTLNWFNWAQKQQQEELEAVPPEFLPEGDPAIPSFGALPDRTIEKDKHEASQETMAIPEAPSDKGKDKLRDDGTADTLANYEIKEEGGTLEEPGAGKGSANRIPAAIKAISKPGNHTGLPLSEEERGRIARAAQKRNRKLKRRMAKAEGDAEESGLNKL